MSADILERALESAAVEYAERLDQIAVEVAQITERSEARASEMHLLAAGEISYFPTLLSESAAEAAARLRPLIEACERKHGVKLQVKSSGSHVRVRRMPDSSKTGPLAEWHNLLPGQSDIIHEYLTDDALKTEMQKARLTCDRLHAEGKGSFEVEAVQDVLYYIRVTRWAAPGGSDMRRREFQYADS